MIFRQLSKDQFTRLNDDLMKLADAEPLDASYKVKMTVNGTEYIVKVQPEQRNKVVVLQALRIFREDHGPNFELITTPCILFSLLELMIYQGLHQFPR